MAHLMSSIGSQWQIVYISYLRIYFPYFRLHANCLYINVNLFCNIYRHHKKTSSCVQNYLISCTRKPQNIWNNHCVSIVQDSNFATFMVHVSLFQRGSHCIICSAWFVQKIKKQLVNKQFMLVFVLQNVGANKLQSCYHHVITFNCTFRLWVFIFPSHP